VSYEREVVRHPTVRHELLKVRNCRCAQLRRYVVSLTSRFCCRARHPKCCDKAALTQPFASHLWRSFHRNDITDLSFFLSLTSLYLLIVGVDGYCCTRSHSMTHTLGRTPLGEGSARRRDLYLTTHKSQETDNHAPSEIRTHNPSKRAAAVPRLRPRGQWDGLYNWLTIRNICLKSTVLRSQK
jgi:hypothetical protein